MIEPIKQLEKKFYQLLSTDVAMQNFLNDESFAGIWFWDLNNRNHIWLSQSLKKLLGFDKDYLLQIPLSWNELLPINDIDTICSSFDAYLAKGKEDAIEIDIPFLQKNSRINFLKCRAIAVNDQSYLLGLVQIQNHNEGFRTNSITEFSFTNPGSKQVGKVPVLKPEINKDQAYIYSSKYESLIKAGNLGGWEYKVDTGELWCSKEYFELLGYDTTSIKSWEKYSTQKVWIDLLHPDDVEYATSKFADFLKNLNGGYHQQFRMKHANGHWIWISSKGSLIFEEIDGVKILMIIGTHTDISESKRLEQQLFESNALVLQDNALLKSIINSPEDIFVVSIDTEYRFTSFSNNYIKFTKEKFNKNIYIGYKVLDLFNEMQLNVFKPALDAALKGETYEIKAAIPVNENQLSYVENKYNPILNDYGKVIGATVFIHDVTKEKKAEIANKINELRYASLFSGASDAIFIANSKKGYIVDVNLKAEELMGYTKSELVTMHQSQIHPPELLEEIKNKFKEFTSTDEFHYLETFVLTKDGNRIPVQITSGSSFRIGDEIFSAAYFKDITSRKIIAKELEKQQQQLKEIAWTQSHLVRAPLTRIMGLANALQKGIVPDCEIATYLKFIKSSSDELDSVIKEITSKTIMN